MFDQKTKGNSASVQIGSWDKKAVKDGQTLTMIGTVDKTTWLVPVRNTKIGETEYTWTNQRQIQFDPHFPYLFVPKNDWSALQKDIFNIYES